jgi:hypothetical protein
MSTEARIPADIIHRFEIRSHGDFSRETSLFQLSFLSDRGSCTVKSSRADRTFKFGFSWKGIKQGALEGLVMTQTLKSDGRYCNRSGTHVEDTQTIPTDSIGSLPSRGEVNLAMEDPIPSRQINLDLLAREMKFEYKISFTRRPRDAGEMSEHSARAKSAKLYFSEFSLPRFGQLKLLTMDHTDTIDRKHSNDVRFVFPLDQGEDLEIWANTKTLVDACPYFKALLNSYIRVCRRAIEK